MTPAKILIGFLAGFLSVLIFQQGLIAILHGIGVVPFAPWGMTPVPPLGVPQVLSGAFWGGLWGIAYAFLEPWLSARLSWWLGSLVFGAVLPVLVLWFIVMPLKGQPVGGGFVPSSVLLTILIHAFFGLGAAAFFRIGVRLTRPSLRHV